ncbi:MAG: DEAD/DEAH box helicase, partial [Fimbriimonadaceae bacterium]|nr:DEAD/DEAH box helicase [Fimbriimonadaceae bacterium]
MEGPVDPQVVADALGTTPRLPSVDELVASLVQAELDLLLGIESPADAIEPTGWYLLWLASHPDARGRYGIERQRAAFQVAAHIFDLLLSDRSLAPARRQLLVFAGQVAYLGSGEDPNAMALYRRALRPENLDLVTDFDAVALTLGTAILGFDVGYLFDVLRPLRAQVDAVPSVWAVTGVEETIYGAAGLLTRAVWDLLVFLVYGRDHSLDRATDQLKAALTLRVAEGDRLSRWVAYHLLRLCDGLQATSVWRILPPEVPAGTRLAFTLGHPRVLTLWPPQVDLLGPPKQEGAPNVFSQDVTRVLLSMPTSAGKTLVAQLLIAGHLSAGGRSVCYVAPTRSLCDEVRHALRIRFRCMRFRVQVEEPAWWNLHPPEEAADVLVMTPEQLAVRIRTNPQQVIDHFGLFVIDEAHHLSDDSRGWTLEWVLSYLHTATEGRDHRLVLISAALGNREHLAAWLRDGGQAPYEFHRDWRGPRRITSVYTTSPDWSVSEDLPVRGSDDQREMHPLYGQLHIRVGHDHGYRTLRTTEPVGRLVRRWAKGERPHRDNSKSTPFYQCLAPLIASQCGSGSVLAIEATRDGARRLAQAVAGYLEPIQEDPELFRLRGLVRRRLGIDHPLDTLLGKGVAFHYGPLPADVRGALEDALRAGSLRCLVSTTTLAEGVNLAVRTVVVASTGWWGIGGFHETVTGATLLNAIGRAGRATRETEGVVVIAHNGPGGPEQFDQL